MSFPLTPASPFTAFVTTIPAAVLNAWRVSINESLDGTGGGTYTPSTPLTINGSGMVIDPLSAWVRSGHFLKVDSGGTLETEVGATATFNSGVTFNGNTQFDGSTNSVTGGTWGFYVPTYVVGGAQLHIGDTINGVGSILVEGAGAGSGSNITVQGSGAFVEIKGNTSFLVDSGATAILDGSTTISNLVSATQTGQFTKSGSGARSNFRIGHPATPDQDQHFDPTEWDVITLNNLTSFGSARTWTLDDPSWSGGGQTAFVYVVGSVVGVVGGGGSDPCVVFKNSAGDTIATFNETTTGGGVLFYWETAGTYETWMPLMKWGSVT